MRAHSHLTLNRHPAPPSISQHIASLPQSSRSHGAETVAGDVANPSNAHHHHHHLFHQLTLQNKQTPIHQHYLPLPAFPIQLPSFARHAPSSSPLHPSLMHRPATMRTHKRLSRSQGTAAAYSTSFPSSPSLLHLTYQLASWNHPTSACSGSSTQICSMLPKMRATMQTTLAWTLTPTMRPPMTQHHRPCALHPHSHH